jgi:hypothetical protein
VLTGSANFALLQSLGQSLAGRTTLLELLPLSLEEVRHFPDPPTDLLDLLFRGSAPATYDVGRVGIIDQDGTWCSARRLRPPHHGARAGCDARAA